MSARDEVIAAAFAALDRQVRRASIAEVGGFDPPPATITSSFGGRFVAEAGDRWPEHGGVPMIPLLQVRVDELPHRPPEFEGIALLNVFVAANWWETIEDAPTENGNGWLLRSYSRLDGLMPLDPPGEPEVSPCPVRWRLSEAEGPDRDDARDVCDLTDFAELNDADELLHGRYDRHLDTKVGGWPSYAQSSIGSDGFAIQIGSEDHAGWMWGDCGNGYLYLRDGKWYLHWDCY